MNKYLILIFSVICCIMTSCKDEETYAEQKEKERDVIASFLNRDVYVVDQLGDTLCHVGNVNVINETQFEAQGYTTDLSQNQYVLFSNTGVYMQIERPGTGEKLESGKSVHVACQFIEYNILGDSLQLRSDVNYWASSPDIMKVTNNYGTFTAYFDTDSYNMGAMCQRYQSTSVPGGWLVPFTYIRIGRQTGPEGIAKVRLIVPHTQGHQAASSAVYPCFYQITYQKLRE